MKNITILEHSKDNKCKILASEKETEFLACKNYFDFLYLLAVFMET